jgi:hypothetical protein
LKERAIIGHQLANVQQKRLDLFERRPSRRAVEITERETARFGNAFELCAPVIVRHIADYWPHQAKAEIGGLREWHVGVGTTPSVK